MAKKPSCSEHDSALVVHGELVRQLLHNSLSALLSGLLTAVLVFFVLIREFPREMPAAWLALYTLTVLIRLATIKFIQKTGNRLGPALQAYTFFSFLGGLCWVSLLSFLVPGTPLAMQLFLLVVVCGVPISGLSSISVYPPVFAAMNLPIFVGLVAWALLAAPGFRAGFTGLALMYALLLSISAKAYYDNMRGALLARLDNRELVRKLSRANQELEELAYKDPVTGLSNRRWFEHQLELALQQCAQRDIPLALLLIDLDHFKQINDTHGHHIGARVLRHTALCLSAMLKELPQGGYAARYGGDEFVAALPGTPPERAVALATKLLEEISEKLHFGEDDCQPSATIGIAIYPDDAHTVDKLTRHADMAMYAAKRLGRNRLHLYNSTAPPGATDATGVTRLSDVSASRT